MDALADLLASVRLSGSPYFRSILNAPWGMSVPDSDTAQFHVIRRGRCWLLPVEPSAFEPQLLEAGDIVASSEKPPLCRQASIAAAASASR